MPKFGTDYTKSALDLKNPLEVRDLLLTYGKAKAAHDEADAAYTEATNDIPEAVALAKAYNVPTM